MSGYLPQGSTLQLSNTAGDISHQGVLGSNLSGTTNLTASSSNFPSSSTGTSVGHYHYTDASTKSLKFLNASGSGTGGHEFFVSSSTQAPVKTFSVDPTSLSLDTKIKNSSSNTELDLAFNELRIKNDLSRVLLVHEALKFIYNDVVNVQVNNSPENPNIYFSSATNNSQLTATDLKFDGVSLKDQVETNKDDIDLNLIKNVNTLNVYNSSSVYADGRPPLAVPTTTGNSYGQFGWYFQNSFSSGVNKINWYVLADIDMKVSDLVGLYLRYFNLSSTGVNDIPFIAIYTKTDNITPNAASWYKSRLTLVPNFIPSINTNYTTQYKFISTVPDASHYNSTLSQMIYSTVGTNPNGAFAPTEIINFFAVSTSSSSAVNASEFIFQKLGLQTLNGSHEFIFQPLIA